MRLANVLRNVIGIVIHCGPIELEAFEDDGGGGGVEGSGVIFGV